MSELSHTKKGEKSVASLAEGAFFLVRFFLVSAKKMNNGSDRAKVSKFLNQITKPANYQISKFLHEKYDQKHRGTVK